LFLNQIRDVDTLQLSAPPVVKRQLPVISWRAWFYTILGVTCFSGTFPATRLALESFDSMFIALVRGSIAGCAALVFLLASRSKLPTRSQFGRLFAAGLGMVVTFPIAISKALEIVPATHASVVAAILPLATALFGVLRGRERAPLGFWVAALFGTILIALFCGYRSGFSGIDGADLLLLAGFIACAYGYAEGGLLSRELGGWKVICWVLVAVLPFEMSCLIFKVFTQGIWVHLPIPKAWGGLLYVTAISQFLGFYFYYKGLALGGVTRMSQVQLFLPFAGFYVAHWVLGESVDISVILGALAMTMIVLAGKLSINRGAV
jgi:drug/metabolite transporter (DMT)-like permease